jgi:hypothetical protein
MDKEQLETERGNNKGQNYIWITQKAKKQTATVNKNKLRTQIYGVILDLEHGNASLKRLPSFVGTANDSSAYNIYILDCEEQCYLFSVCFNPLSINYNWVSNGQNTDNKEGITTCFIPFSTCKQQNEELMPSVQHCATLHYTQTQCILTICSVVRSNSLGPKMAGAKNLRKMKPEITEYRTSLLSAKEFTLSGETVAAAIAIKQQLESLLTMICPLRRE